MKNKNFIIIVIGQIISLFGNSIQRFSMSLYLLEFTGSTAAFARILAISTIPYIIFAPIAGRLSDKIKKKCYKYSRTSHFLRIDKHVSKEGF